MLLLWGRWCWTACSQVRGVVSLARLRVFGTITRTNDVARTTTGIRHIPSGLAAHLHRLRARLKISLFVHRGRHLHLSPTKRGFLHCDRRVLTLISRTQDIITNSRPRNLFSLNSLRDATTIHVPTALTRFGRHCPGVRFSLSANPSNAVLRKILRKGLGTTFVSKPVGRATVSKVPMCHRRLVVIAPRNRTPMVHTDRIGNDGVCTFHTGYSCHHRFRD